ncbi:MAG TPA: septation regulator SpoVG [Candidatus Polarisedimenticolaceae bacterium]|nr:septation regulator SpoVG [Candidatus Polarisedimenticolaceae bacterium]
MQITQVKVFPVEEDKLKAFVSVIFDDCFVVSDIKIIEGNNGLFISMPSKKRKNGTFRDIAHPLNNETRRWIEEQIIAKYREVLTESGGDAESSPRIRRLGEGAEDDESERIFEAPLEDRADGRSWS